MRKIFVFAMVGIAVVMMGFCPAGAALKAEYKLSSNVSETSGHGQATAYFAKLVSERTNGEVNIKPYWGAQLMAGKPSNEFSLIRGGAIDFAHSSFINWAPQFPQGNLFLLPWFISGEPDKYKALDAIEHGKAGKMIEEMMDKQGIVVIGWGENGYRELTNSKHPIRKPDDIKDLKIRVVGSPLFLDIFSALGANPTNINFAESLTALQQGVVDGQENPIMSTIISYKIYEMQKYITIWSYNVDPYAFVVNQKSWASFTPEQQKIIRECAEEAGKYNKAMCRLGLDNGESKAFLESINAMPTMLPAEPYKFLEQSGCEVAVLTQEEIAAFKEKTAPVLKNWIEKVGPELVKAAEEDMKSVR
ncbi:exported protein [Synergistales bacterium]|nr:exported protein [Synergistales bacterium]